MFVKSIKIQPHKYYTQYEFDCGKNEYELVFKGQTIKISGYCYLIEDCGSDGWFYDCFLMTYSGCYNLEPNDDIEELVDLFNQQIQDSYNVGGKHYIESEKKVEQLCN